MRRPAKCVEAAIDLGGNAGDRTALAACLHQIFLPDTARGRSGSTISATSSATCSSADASAGMELVNIIIKRYADVSQFWTYDEKAFLANPV